MSFFEAEVPKQFFLPSSAEFTPEEKARMYADFVDHCLLMQVAEEVYAVEVANRKLLRMAFDTILQQLLLPVKVGM